MIEAILNSSMNYWIKSIWMFLTGIFTSLVGYFMPVKDIIHYIVILFIIDSIIGYWSAKKTKKQKFSLKIIFRTTVSRMFMVVLLMMLLYAWDETFDQFAVHTYKIVGWFFAGILLANIVQNMYKITKWKTFVNIGDFIINRTNLKKK